MITSKRTLGLIIAVLILVTAGGVHAQVAGDIPWATAGANAQRTSWTSNEAGGALKALWVKRIVPYVSQKVQPVGAENMVFLSTARGVYAFDADTGAQKWVYITEMPIGHSPTYHAGILYAAGLDRKVHAINVLNGTKKWVFDASPEGGAGFSTSPLFAENTIFAGSRDGNMYALDAATGAKKWKYKIEGTGPILFSAAYANSKIFFGAQDGNAYALTTGGALSWKVKLPGMGFISWWPVIYNDKVIFTRTEEQRNTSNDFTGGKDFGYERDTIIGGSNSDNPAGQVVTHTIGSQTKVADVKTNPNMPTTIPNYFENNPHQRNVFILNQTNGVEINFDIDNDGKTDAVPVLRSVQDWVTAYPPVLSGYNSQNILYFRTPLFQNDAFPGSRATGWEYGSSYLSLVVSKHFGQSLAWPLDEYTGLSGGGRYIYWNLCCDRFVGSTDISKSNTAYPLLDTSRQWRHLTGKIGENSGDLPTNYFEQAKKFFWNDPSASDGGGRFYMSHGDNLGPAIYDGKMYVIRSNALIAFAPNGLGADAPMSDAVAPTSLGEPAGTPPISQLVNILESEVQKMINAGHLKPGYGIVGNFDQHMQSKLGDQLLDYWHAPGDIHYVLTRALPYLSAGLKTQVKTYLTNEFNVFPPYQYSHIGWKDGKFRDSFSYPPGMGAIIATKGPSTSTIWEGMWNWPPQQMYAMWLYAKENPSQAATIFNSAKSKLSAGRPAYCSPNCPAMWPQAVNGLIAGYKGYVELAKLAGQPSSVYGPYETTLSSLLAERKNNFQINLVQTLGTTGTNNAANYYATLIQAWNFIFLTPELGDYLNINIKSTVQSAINQFTKGIACPTTSGVYCAYIPMWFEAMNREVQGEGAASPYQQTHALFQAKALILKEGYNELAKYLDAPMMVGDLYYIDNLIVTIQASSNPPPPVTSTPTPPISSTKTPTPPAGKPGDANGDGKVDGSDYLVWVFNYGQNVSGPSKGDFNSDGKADGQDYLIWVQNYGI